MRKQLLTALSAFLMCSGVQVMAQCPFDCGTTGAPQPVAPTTTACNDGSTDGSELEITSWDSEISGFNNYQIVITAPSLPLLNADGTVHIDTNDLDGDGDVEEQEEGEAIIGLSDDGTFDFSGFAAGDYTFTAFAFNQAELDGVAGFINPLLPALTGDPNFPPIPVPAALGEVFGALDAALGPITICDVEYAVCSLLAGLPGAPTLAYSKATSYTVSVDVCTGIEETAVNNSLAITSLSPMPASNTVNIELNNPRHEDVTISVYSIEGQLVETTSAIDALTLDISRYANGMYLVNVTNGLETVTTKMIKR